MHKCLLANLSPQQSLTSYCSQINSIDVRFADLQQRVFEMQALSDEVLQRLQAKNSQMEELVRATFNQGIARGDDVWIICASSRFAISPRRASECSEWFDTALSSGMREQSLKEIHLDDVDNDTAGILRLCLGLGPTSVHCLESLPCAGENLMPVLNAIRIAHRLFMAWMATSLAKEFAQQFAVRAAMSQPAADQVQATVQIGFEALRLASQMQDAVQGNDEDAMWAHVCFHLKSSTMPVIAQNIELAVALCSHDFHQLDPGHLQEVISLVKDGLWSDWQQCIVPHGPGCSTAWTSSPSALGPHAADFVLEVTNLEDKCQTTNCDTNAADDGAVGVFVHLKDTVKAFKSHVGPTLFNASGLFRFQVVAQPNDMLEMPLREHAGRLGVTTELYAGGWGWGQFIHRSDRDRFTHIDDDSLKDAGLLFKFAYRASFLQLHRQTFALAHYVRSRTDLSDHCVSDSAVLLALTFDFFRNLPDEHGRVARQILCKFISRGLECLVLSQPIVFASLTREEIHAILYHTQRDPSPSLHDSTVLWIHGAYVALKRSLQAAQETVREQTRAEGDVLLGAEEQLPGLIEQPPPAFPPPLPPGCTPVPSSHALNPLLPTALDKQKGIMVMERSL